MRADVVFVGGVCAAIAALAGWYAAPAAATVYVSDNFDSYADGSRIADSAANPGTPWIVQDNTNPQNGQPYNDARIDAGRMKLSADNKEDITLPLGTTISQGGGEKVYIRFTVRIYIDNLFFPPIGLPDQDPLNTPPDYDGNYFAHLRDNSLNYRARIYTTRESAAAGMYRIGISNGSNKSPANEDVPNVVFPRDLSPHTTYTVVVCYDVDAFTTELWINPASDADTKVTAADTPTGISVTRFSLRQANYMGLMQLDDLKIGSTWADVVSPRLDISATNNPADSAHPAGTADIHVATYDLAFQGGGGTLAGIAKADLFAGGTGNDLDHIADVKVILDANGNGNYDAGIDQIVGQGTFDKDDGTLSFTPGFNLTGGAMATLFVLYSLASSGAGVTNGETFTPTLQDVIATNAIADGMPLVGATLTVADSITVTNQSGSNANVNPGSAGVVFGTIDVFLSGGASDLSGVTFSFTGTGTETELSNLRLMHDDGNGSFDGNDTQLGTGSFIAGSMLITIASPVALTPQQNVRLFLVGDLAGTAADFNTYVAGVVSLTVSNGVPVYGPAFDCRTIVALRPGTLGKKSGCGIGPETAAGDFSLPALMLLLGVLLAARRRWRVMG